jgi:acyl dehydratase
MLTVETPFDLKQHVGEELGTSDWITVDQEMIQRFADATGDHQWIHVDVERCKTEMPGGKPIAHGYLTLSLLPIMMQQLVKVTKRSRGINYGSNKVRFTGPVPAGSRVRARAKLKAVEDIKGNGVQIFYEVQVEREGEERPVLVAETIGLSYA